MKCKESSDQISHEMMSSVETKLFSMQLDMSGADSSSKPIEDPMIRLNLLKLHGYKPVDAKTQWTSIEMFRNWTQLYKMQAAQPPKPLQEKQLILCIHGAGHSAAVFTLLAKEMAVGGYDTVAYDLRGHSLSPELQSDTALDMDINSLVEDFTEVLFSVGKGKSVLIVGHSLGGSIAARGLTQLLKNNQLLQDDHIQLAGLILIEASEGLAIKHFPDMISFLDTRPKIFANQELGIQWAVEHNQVFNPQSARISIPTQLCPFQPSPSAAPAYTWLADPLSQRRHWQGWFKGLTALVSALSLPKLLLAAGEGRIDQQLIRDAQDGLCSVAVVRNCGHSLMEDDPREVGQLVGRFAEKCRDEAAGGFGGFKKKPKTGGSN